MASDHRQLLGAGGGGGIGGLGIHRLDGKSERISGYLPGSSRAPPVHVGKFPGLGAADKASAADDKASSSMEMPPGGDAIPHASRTSERAAAQKQAAKRAPKAKAKRRGPELPVFAVAGTWDNWNERVMRHNKETGAYEFTMMIGDKGWESFKILLEGDWAKCFYPDQADANPYDQHKVCGPADAWQHQELSWTIGRSVRDAAKEGVCYKIFLWLTKDNKVAKVDWVRRDFGTGDLVQLVAMEDAPQWNGLCGNLGERIGMGWQVYVDGVGYVLLEPNNFKTIETQASEEQVISVSASEDELEVDVLLTGERVELTGLQAHPTWNGLKGTLTEQIGQRWKVDVDGVGIKLLQAKNLQKEQKVRKVKREKSKKESEAGQPQYSIAGTWDKWTLHKMNWDVERRCFQYNTQLGEDCEESFQILQNGEWENCLHPDAADACLHTDFKLCGPDGNGQGLHWTIGKHQLDKGVSGACYEVRLFLDESGKSQKVDWVLLDGPHIGAAVPTRSADTADAVKGQAEHVNNAPTDEATVNIPSGEISTSESNGSPDVKQLAAIPEEDTLTDFLRSGNSEWARDEKVLEAVKKKLSLIGFHNAQDLCAAIRENPAILNIKLKQKEQRLFSGSSLTGLADAGKRWDLARREREFREEHRRQREQKLKKAEEAKANAIQEPISLHLSVPVLRFKVVHENALVRNQPSFDAPVIGCKDKFDVVGATEETFDGWVRLSDDPGWILRDMGGHRGVHDVLLPLAKPFLVAATDALEGPSHLGPLGRPVFLATDNASQQGRKFKVLLSPAVDVHTQPDKKSTIIGSCKEDEEVTAMAQTYDGWLRVRIPGPDGSSKDGYVLACDLENGIMLQCTELEERRLKVAQMFEAEQELANAVSTLNREWLEQALEMASKAGVEASKLKEAEQAIVQLERHAVEVEKNEAKLKAQREQFRRDIEGARNNEGELQEMLHFAERQAWSEEISLAARLIDEIGKRNDNEKKALRERIQQSKGDATKLLKCVGVAEKAGLTSEVKLAQHYLDKLSESSVAQERKRTAADRRQREGLMKKLARAAMRGNEAKVEEFTAAALEAGLSDQEIKTKVILSRIEGAARNDNSLKVRQFSEEAEDACIDADEIRKAFMNGRIQREEKAGGVESASDKVSDASDDIASLLSDPDEGDKATSSDRRKPGDETEDPTGRPPKFAYNPLILVGSCNSWSVEEARLRFALQPIKVGPAYAQNQHRVYLRIHDNTDEPVEFQLIGAKDCWDFRIYPDSTISGMLELDIKSRALVACGRDNEVAHGRNFTIQPQEGVRDIEVRILWKSNTDVWVWYAIPKLTAAAAATAQPETPASSSDRFAQKPTASPTNFSSSLAERPAASPTSFAQPSKKFAAPKPIASLVTNFAKSRSRAADGET